MRRSFLILLIFTVVLGILPAALASEKVVPVVIEAQKLTYSDKKKIAYYIGNVIAQHGNTVIKGDKLTIYFDPTGKHIRKIIVEGNVYIKDPRGEGWCEKLFYYPAQEKVVLIGNAKLRQKDNVIIGDKIIAYKDGEVKVEGVEQRVKTVIYPEENKGGSGS